MKNLKTAAAGAALATAAFTLPAQADEPPPAPVITTIVNEARGAGSFPYELVGLTPRSKEGAGIIVKIPESIGAGNIAYHFQMPIKTSGGGISFDFSVIKVSTKDMPSGDPEIPDTFTIEQFTPSYKASYSYLDGEHNFDVDLSPAKIPLVKGEELLFKFSSPDSITKTCCQYMNAYTTALWDGSFDRKGLYILNGEEMPAYNADLAFTFNAISAPPVPEPETYAMMLAGLGVLGAVARRRKEVDQKGKEVGQKGMALAA